MKKIIIFLTLISIYSCGGGSGGGSNSNSNLYIVKITNNSKGNEITLTNGQKIGALFSPTLVVVHHDVDPVFKLSQKDFGAGLEQFVEELDPSSLLASLQTKSGVELLGLGSKPENSESASLLQPGQSYNVTIKASQNSRLTILTSFVFGNDTFFATSQSGELLSDILNNNGVVTIGAFDLGTEVNQPFATNASQVGAPNPGIQENGVVTNANTVVTPGLLTVAVTRAAN